MCFSCGCFEEFSNFSRSKNPLWSFVFPLFDGGVCRPIIFREKKTLTYVLSRYVYLVLKNFIFQNIFRPGSLELISFWEGHTKDDNLSRDDTFWNKNDFFSVLKNSPFLSMLPRRSRPVFLWKTKQ